uniref:PTB domain-containing engulfment adapter protein 1-like n=1 Tax=Hippocampus comes TaxID=109280 RepID=A0A3Q3DUZ2_HIPCM
MSDTEDDNEISFTVKFLGRVEVVRHNGLNILEEAAQSLKTPDPYASEKAAKKSKVHLFVSLSGIDILENKTKFLLYTCPLPTISFCAVLPSSPKVFGFVAKHPAVDMYHCYLFKSETLVSMRTFNTNCKLAKRQRQGRQEREREVCFWDGKGGKE